MDIDLRTVSLYHVLKLSRFTPYGFDNRYKNYSLVIIVKYIYMFKCVTDMYAIVLLYAQCCHHNLLIPGVQ